MPVCQHCGFNILFIDKRDRVFRCIICGWRKYVDYPCNENVTDVTLGVE